MVRPQWLAVSAQMVRLQWLAVSAQMVRLQWLAVSAQMVARNGWPREWIYCQVQGGRCFPRLPQLPLHNTPTSIMRRNAKPERDNGCGNEDRLFYSS